MSELQVNSISSSTNTGVRINSSVGIGTNFPATNGIKIAGKLDVSDNNVEVVTVSGSNYGVKIKSPSNLIGSDAILKFSNYDGSTRASITSNQDNDIIFRNNGFRNTTVGIMNEISGLTIESQTKFKNNAVFTESVQVKSPMVFDTNHIPQTPKLPVDDNDLVNFKYFKNFLLGSDNVKTFSVFGSSNQNANINTGLAGCCGTYPPIADSGIANTSLVGTGVWLAVAFNHGRRSCSCHDNESFAFPYDSMDSFFVYGDSGMKIIDGLQEGWVDLNGYVPIYACFGFAIRLNVPDAEFAGIVDPNQLRNRPVDIPLSENNNQ